MNWLEITVDTKPGELEQVAGQLMELGAQGLVINDESSVNDFLEHGPKSWDYIGDEVYEAVRGISSIQFYLEDSESGYAELTRILSLLPEASFSVKQVRDEDWENNWRQYYKPMRIGDRLLIVPAWEPVPEGTNRVVLKLEPKNIFGNGSHASTIMCLEELEQHPAQAAKQVLDLGCGSGILSIAALLLGAESAIACDIVEDAPKVALENGILNGIDSGRLTVFTGDILSEQVLAKIAGGRRFDIVFANIVADVIIALSPHVKNLLSREGVFICSGIIEGRQEEVTAALTQNGLAVIHARNIDNWHAFAARAIVSQSPL
jgi:ribosomal protein L11 methyltransferase